MPRELLVRVIGDFNKQKATPSQGNWRCV